MAEDNGSELERAVRLFFVWLVIKMQLAIANAKGTLITHM